MEAVLTTAASNQKVLQASRNLPSIGYSRLSSLDPGEIVRPTLKHGHRGHASLPTSWPLIECSGDELPLHLQRVQHELEGECLLAQYHCEWRNCRPRRAQRRHRLDFADLSSPYVCDLLLYGRCARAGLVRTQFAWRTEACRMLQWGIRAALTAP